MADVEQALALYLANIALVASIAAWVGIALLTLLAAISNLFGDD